jgi:hypothetical protein
MRNGGCEWMKHGRCGDNVVATLIDDRPKGLGEIEVCAIHRDLFKSKEWAEVVSNATALQHVTSGERAHDRESDDESQMLVLGPHGKTAEECYIAAIDQTVAEANPEYPASDPVADVAFVADIESAMGIDWSAFTVVQLYKDDDLDRARILSYSYPESRLEEVEAEENDV